MVKDLTVIIPAYNEEGSISDAIKQVFEDVPGANVVVVDDCSWDRTPEILAKLKKTYSNLIIVTHNKNGGYGAALKTGFRAAKTMYISFLDADMTYPPKYIPLLLSEVKGKNLDCCWCNRFSGRSKMPLIRKIGNKLLIALFFILNLRYVADVSSGERLFTKEALKKIDFSTLPNGLDMITAMTKRVVYRRIKFSLIKCEYMKREGASKLNLITDFLKMSRNIIIEK